MSEDRQSSLQPSRRVRIQARGRVQGVGFRATARAQGRTLGVDVDARNLSDGSVLIEASGPDDAIEAFLAWAAAGPPTARVDELTVEELPEEP